MRLSDIVATKGKYALVGRNSQGKTYSLNEFFSKHKSTTIFIENESKANEALKSSISSSPLVEWLERLLELKELQKVIDKQIGSIELPDSFSSSNLNIKFNNSISNYKGLISAEVQTKSNNWGKPGSGETFLGELLLVEQMINQGKKNPIKYLVIDEPETFLHRTLYAKVTSILRRLSEKMTIIVSTHSSDFLDLYSDDFSEIIMVRNGKLIPLKCDDEYINVILKMDVYDLHAPNMDKQTKNVLSDFHNYYKCFIKPTLTKCLFNQVVVLGEGAAENALFDCMRRYFANTGFSGYTDYYGLYGKYLMPAYMEILKQLGLNVVVLFDRDEKNSPSPWKESINQYLTSKADAYHSFEDEIETDLGFGKIDRKEKGVKSSILIQMAFVKGEEKTIRLMRELAAKIESVYKDEIPCNLEKTDDSI